VDKVSREQMCAGKEFQVEGADTEKAWEKNKQQQQRPFNGLWSGTTWVGRYQKKHSPIHTHPDHRASFITFLHLQRPERKSC